MKKQLILGLLGTGLACGSIGLISYANSSRVSDDKMLDFKGVVYITNVMGMDKDNIDVSCITNDYKLPTTFSSDEHQINLEKMEKDYIENIRSYGLFSMKKNDVISFIKYIIQKDNIYSNIFNLKEIENIYATEEFDLLWKEAANLNEKKFAMYQQNYIMETKVIPIIEDINENIGVNIMGNRVLEELLFTNVIKGDPIYIDYIKEALSSYNNVKEVNIEEVIDVVINKEIDFIKSQNNLDNHIIESKVNDLEKERLSLKEM